MGVICIRCDKMLPLSKIGAIIASNRVGGYVMLCKHCAMIYYGMTPAELLIITDPEE